MSSHGHLLDLDTFTDVNPGGRRRANDAFRALPSRIDLTSSKFTQKLFSCKNCEQPLNAFDRKQLCIDEAELPATTARLRGVVIDGTAAGILKQLPRYKRTKMPLAAVRIRARRCLLFGKRNVSAVKYLCRLSRKAARLAAKSLRSGSSKVSFSIPSSKSRQKTKGLSESQIDTIRIYISEQRCICSTTDDQHSPECGKKRNVVEKTSEFKIVSKLLRPLFTISKFNSSMNIVDLEDSADNFASSDDHELEQGSFEDGDNARDSIEEVQGDIGWCATLQIELQSHMGSSVIEKALDALLFLLTHPTAYPYLIHATPTNAYPEPRNISPSKTMGKHCRALSYSSIRIHEELSSNLEDFSSCLHNGIGIENYPCQDCFEKVQVSHDQLAVLNPPLAAFCGSLLQGEIENVAVLREISSSFALVIKGHIYHAEEYFERLDQAITPEASTYWSNFGSGTISVLKEASETAEESGICFPGRRMYRPTISFEGTEDQECSKTVLRTDTHSDGILTVQCVCSTPKLLGFIVMNKPESTEVALNSVLTHFKIPPRVVFYDNACNLFASALLRVPWLLNLSRFLVDRFHFKSHNCSTFFDPSSYRDLDVFKTTGAESINARIEKVLHFLRHLRGGNYVPFLRARFALLNLGSLIREDTGKLDLEEFTLWREFQNYFICACAVCVQSSHD